MTYAVKEIFYTLQGEGANAGRPAVFCRFAGCNLWTGREADRADAVCQFCDTDFVGTDGPGGGKFATAAGAGRRRSRGPGRLHGRRPHAGWWSAPAGSRSCSSTQPPSRRSTRRGFEVAVETNGTIAPPPGIDWICVSPQGRRPRWCCARGDELKLVFPQAGGEPERYRRPRFPAFLPAADGRPRPGPQHDRWRVAYCLAHPEWRLSLQTHKMLGIP